MKIRRGVARLYWRLSRWRPDPTPPPASGTGILIGAPHTSNWDFVLMIALAWDWGVPVRYLGKSSLFRPPYGWLMRALGGIPVDRSNPAGLVDAVVEDVQAGRTSLIVITPEGKRGTTDYWKSGFYRVAMATGLEVTLGYVDRRVMTAGLGRTLRMTGDVRADMDRIREFYDGKVGVRPEGMSVPRLRAEDEPLP